MIIRLLKVPLIIAMLVLFALGMALLPLMCIVGWVITGDTEWWIDKVVARVADRLEILCE